MQDALARQLAVAREELKARPNTVVLYLQHRSLITDPEKTTRQIVAFLEPVLDKMLCAEAMAGCVDPSLHRQRPEGHAP
jgi:hypothetical protein